MGVRAKPSGGCLKRPVLRSMVTRIGPPRLLQDEACRGRQLLSRSVTTASPSPKWCTVGRQCPSRTMHSSPLDWAHHRSPEMDGALVSRQLEEEVLSVLASQSQLLEPTDDCSRGGCSSPPERIPGTSLGARWIGICLPMQGTWVQPLVQEDPTCLRWSRKGPARTAVEPKSCN